MWRGPAWLVIVQDLAALVVGIIGVMRQILSADPSLELIALFGVFMVAPGVLATLLPVRNTEPPSSPPPSPPSPPVLPSPSSSVGEP